MWVAPIVGIAAFLGIWEAFVRLRDVRPFVLAAPTDILRYLDRAPGDFVAASLVTSRHALVGFVAALVISLVVGSLLVASPFAERAVQPVLVLIQVAPFVAYISSIVLWLGAGDPPAYFATALVCLPAFVFATVSGMRGADPASRELFASVDASRWEVMWRLRLPSAMPSLFTTARYSIGLALIVSYLVEAATSRRRAWATSGSGQRRSTSPMACGRRCSAWWSSARSASAS